MNGCVLVKSYICSFVHRQEKASEECEFYVRDRKNSFVCRYKNVIDHCENENAQIASAQR